MQAGNAPSHRGQKQVNKFGRELFGKQKRFIYIRIGPANAVGEYILPIYNLISRLANKLLSLVLVIALRPSGVKELKMHCKFAEIPCVFN